MGGSDDPSNLVEVSITQHIMWHFANWKLHGNYKDKVAYKLLANTDASEEKEEARKQAIRNFWKKNPNHSKLHAHKVSATKKKDGHNISRKLKQNYADGTRSVPQSFIDGGKISNQERSRGVMDTKTGIIYPSIRAAAREAHAGRNYIKKCIREGLDRWKEV